ncbi:MAG TPA: hypothetical protein VN541_03855, partial [Tepidisphaeraceae bacterium]|nr:hypothetical protein [Tepidisphaeraceae bacterium]
MNTETPYEGEPDHVLDRAVSERLARLRSVPVDLSNLDKALKAKLPPPGRQGRWRVLSLRPLRAVAASLVLVCAIAAAILLNASSGPALAEAAQMAQVHQEIVSGTI